MTIRTKRSVLWVVVALIAVIGCSLAFNRGFRETTILIVVIFWTEVTKPNDPVTHRVRTAFKTADHSEGDKISLMPKPLAAGIAKNEVMNELAADKYKPDPNGSLSPAGDGPAMAGEERLYYTMTSSEGACDVFYEVQVDFDLSGHLTQAWGTQTDRLCL